MRDDDSVAALVERGIRAFDRGRFEKARVLFAHAAESGSAVALLNLGSTHRELGRFKEAETAFRAAIAAGETHAALNLGDLLIDLGRADEAREQFHAAAAAGDPRGLIAAAWLLEGDGEHEQALDLFRRAAAGGDPLARGVLGAYLWEHDQSDEAEPHLKAGQDVYPEALVDLAQVYVAAGRPKKARRLLRSAVERGELLAMLPLANLLSDEFGEHDEAEALYRRAIAAGDGHSRYNLGLLLRELGREDEALKLLTAAADNGDHLAIALLAQQ